MTQHLTPRAELLSWLDEQRKAGILVTIPVRMSFTDASRLAPGRTHIAGWAEPGPDTIALTLDDTALGIPLIDRVQELCPADEEACALWLEGSWGPLIGDPDPNDPTLAVRGVRGLVERTAAFETLQAHGALTTPAPASDAPATPPGIADHHRSVMGI